MSPGESSGSSWPRTRRAGSPTRTSPWRGRSRTRSSGGPRPMARSTGRWASSCSRSPAAEYDPTHPPSTRATSSEHLEGHVVDALEVEHGALGLEHGADARLLQLHLRPADGQRAQLEDTVFPLEAVAPVDPLDPHRLGRRVVDH